MLEKKTLGILGGTLIVVAVLVYFGLRSDPQVADDPNATVYYYGEGCPHCKVVNEFLEANNIAEKVSFEKKEVWYNKDNAREMARRAKVCGVAPEGMGVPFVYAEGKCLIGEPDVINFFKTKSGMSSDASPETQK